MENTIKIGFRDTCVNVLFSIINLHGGGVCLGGVCPGKVSAQQGVCVSCDLSHHSFDVTFLMLPVCCPCTN